MIDFYLLKRKLAIEVDELGYKDRKPEKENTRQKEIEECLECTVIRINPDEKDFSAYDELGKIQAVIDKLKNQKKMKNQKNETALFADQLNQDS